MKMKSLSINRRSRKKRHLFVNFTTRCASIAAA